MNLDEKITKMTQAMQNTIIERRRDFHRYAETGWTEFRTASVVADVLSKLGYEVLTGEEVIDEQYMMGVPDDKLLCSHAERAIAQGANADWVDRMKGGKTGIVGIMAFSKPGPTIALRFDLDANDVTESEDSEHRPVKEKFASVNKGAMHACGHDGHIAIGLAVAEVLSELKDSLAGCVKFIFQPAEEGVRGAQAMANKGIVDDVNYLLGMHLGFKMNRTGQIAYNVSGFLATSKFDAVFTGIPAHAGAEPETGRNALLAAATAALNLHAIPRHSQGVSRINVGVLQAGSGRNVIPSNALIKLETRGATSEINNFVAEEAIRIIKSAGTMYNVGVDLKRMGGAAGCNSSPILVEKLRNTIERLGIFSDVKDNCNFGASEDCSYFMERVQENGGQAAYVLIGADLVSGHHDSRFDFDEKALGLATQLLSSASVDLLLG